MWSGISRDAASVSKVRDSYRVRQVGHQLPETEVGTIWLFETTPGVSRSKFPVLQHRSGRQEAALQSESQPQKRPLLISFFSAVWWEKNHSKSLTHLCLLLGASQGHSRGSSQPGLGTPPLRRAEQHQYPHSWLCQLPAFSHNVTLADEPQSQSPGL